MVPSNTITNYRNAVKKLLSALDESREQLLVINSQGGVATLFADPTVFGGANSDINVDQLTSAVVSMSAIDALVTENGNAHLTNLNKLRA